MIYYVIIGIYLIGLLLIGLSKSDSIKNQEDFAVAGRSLSPWILVGTMAATWMAFVLTRLLFSRTVRGYWQPFVAALSVS